MSTSPAPPSAPGRAVAPTPDRGSRARLLALLAVFALLGLWGGVSALVVVVAIVVMIFLHELGHFVTAKAAGMKVTEFFIGFGPRIWSFRRGETEYGLKVVPAGAYVRIIGMNNLDPVEPADEARAYRNKPYWRRMSVAVAGSTMHFVQALVLIFVLLAFWGERSADNWRVGELSRLGTEATSPAIEAGIELGDRIVAIDGQPVTTFSSMADLVRPFPGEVVTVTVVRDGTELDLTATLNETNPDGEAVGFLGVGARFPRDYPYERLGFVDAVGTTFSGFGRQAVETVKGLGSFFSPDGLTNYVDTLLDRKADDEGVGSGASGSDGDRPLSPVGAVRLASQAADSGVPDLLAFLIAMNVFVGIFNLLPILPLDGGHVLIATYERIRSRRGRPYHVDAAKLLPVTYAVVAVLMLLFLSSVFLDFTRPLDNPFGE